MTRSMAAGARTRQRKLSTKQVLQVVREEDEIIEDESAGLVPKIETGVDKAEEIEHHLQAALSTSNAVNKSDQIFIPTPDALPSSLKYDTVYQKRFTLPATYIRFSSTVEDTSGAAYCLSDEDEVFLAQINAKRPVGSQCSNKQFEEVMQFFETTALLKQPYAAVDNPPVLEFEEMHSALEWDELLDESSKAFLVDIYPHWKLEREKMDNSSIMPAIKVRVMEAGQDSEDSDPYVCFRRREPRQVRKTRGRDAQSTDKLKRLRKDLEDARYLLKMVKEREHLKLESLKTDRLLFEQRHNVKMLKRKLGIKTDDEDLINQKKKPKPPVEPLMGNRQLTQLRMPARGESRTSDVDTVLLRDYLAEKEAEKRRKIEEKIMQHKQWNRGFVDITKAPLSPPSEKTVNSDFKAAITEYLPTPPASVSDASENGDAPASPARQEESVTIRYASPSPDDYHVRPTFRRRIGRGGRVMLDRRSMPLYPKTGIDKFVLDRYKYDLEDEDELPIYTIDPFDSLNMRYRASILPYQFTHRQPATSEQQAALAQARAAQAANAQSGSGQTGANAAATAAAVAAAASAAPQVPSMARS